MEAYVERMLVERDELKVKVRQLHEFIYRNEKFKSLSVTKQALMISQLVHMNGYLEVLNDRIYIETTTPSKEGESEN